MNSENGWPVIEKQADSRLSVIRIPGTTIPLRVHRDCAALLAHLASRVDKEVCALRYNNKPGFQDEGGWNYRKIDHSSKFSNHASGTAIDLNWQRWPMFKRKMNAKERAASQRIADDFAEVIRWGGNYSPARVDEMHWEIKPGVSATKIKEFCKARGIRSNGTVA